MSFVNTQYLNYTLILVVVFLLILIRLNKIFFNWIKTYWFFERTIWSRVSSFLYLLSFFLFVIALLDLRGPEKKVKESIPDQRTIIMLDTSLSMLAEDVRPNRFIKAIQLARHFVKNSAGHQISIVLFSDTQKRLIPFTDDIDLIDSRLAALEKTNSVAGGTNISQAITEVIEYFELDSGDDDKSKSGNVIVFTDAEEGEGDFKAHIPSNVNLAMIGIGTIQGASIPLRWEDGSFRGYKSSGNEQVVTKLDENFLKKMGKNVKNYRYWVVNSYSLPTEDILNFFRNIYKGKQGKGDLRVRPVYSHLILVPAIIIYCLSVVFGRLHQFKVAKTLLVITALCVGFSTSFAEDKSSPPLSPKLKLELENIKNGKATRVQVLKTAENLLVENKNKEASELYSEYAISKDEEAVKFNYATSLLKLNKIHEALPFVQDLMKNSKNEDLKNKMRSNLLISMDPSKKKEQDKKQDENKENKKDDKEQQGQKDKDQKDQNKQDKQDKQNKQDKESKDKKESEQKKQDKSGKTGEDKEKKQEKKQEKKEEGKEEKSNENQNEKEQENKKPQSLEEKEKEIEQKRKMVKTPAMIKQILSDDRELQKKMMDTSTNERGKDKPKRDW